MLDLPTELRVVHTLWHTDHQKAQTEAMDPIQTAIILLLVTSVGFAVYYAVAGKVKGVQGKR